MQRLYNDLISKCIDARIHSYSPYSRFSVGAAVLTSDNRIFTGTNVECASYSLCICAERVAFSKAVSEGIKHFKAVAISTSKRSYIYPCGACRQFMYEFAEDLDVIIVKSKNDYIVTKLKHLLPGAFNKKSFNK